MTAVGAWGRRYARGAGRAVLILLALAPAPAAAQLFEPETFTLDNGLRGVVVANARAPVVSHTVWYRAGAIDESDGQAGLAHLAEHLMFKGTKKNPGDAYHRTIAGLGGESNAFTSHDYTGYIATVASEHLDTVMALEADRMANLTLSADDVAQERDVVLAERDQVVEGRPSRLFNELVRAGLFRAHPYRRPIIGWRPTLESLDKAAVESWYDAWYVPSNAVLVVVGDTDVATVRTLADKHFGDLPAGETPQRRRLHEPEPRAAKALTRRDARIGQGQVAQHFLAPSATTGASEHAPALQLLDAVLTGGRNNRLHNALVVEQELASDTWGQYSPLKRGPARFVLGATANPDTDPAALEKALGELVADVRANGISEDALAEAKARVRRQQVFARDGLAPAARFLGAAIMAGPGIDYVEGLFERLGAVTVADVQAAAEHVLQPERRLTGRLLPENPDAQGPAPQPATGTGAVEDQP